MRKVCTLSIFIFFTGLVTLGQKPDEILTRWSDQYPIEKVYLHIPRNTYVSGEIMWFEAYMYSLFFPDTISTSLYVELLDDSSQIISRKIFPVVNSTSEGQLELPDTLPGGRYFIRAYSPTMLNNNPDFIYKHSIFIFSKKNSISENSKQKDSTIRLEFFPEGGNFINGLENEVAFKATDPSGFPVTVSGSVKNGKGEPVVVFASVHDGMGKFIMTPLDNETYSVPLDNDKGKVKYKLPESSQKGITFQVPSYTNGELYYIIQQRNDPDFQASYIIGQMQNQVVFKQPFSATPEKIRGLVKTKDLNSGILQITVFNKDDIPLAERLVFINNKEFIQDATLSMDTINLSNRGKNKFTVLLKDTVSGPLSVSVTDPDYDLYPMRQENIYSNLLLTSDLPGFINNPAYYFSNDNDSVTNATDLVMMTNGWRRFKWQELPRNFSLQRKYEDPAFITLKGSVNIYGTKKYFTDIDLAVFITSIDSSSVLESLKTDANGNFKLDSLIFYGRSRIMFFDPRGRKGNLIDINFKPDSLTKIYPLPPLNTDQFVSLRKYNSLSLAGGGIFSDEYDIGLRAKGLMLPNITVKARKKSAMQELEDRYVSSEFSGGAEQTIDLTTEQAYGANIFYYLQSRVAGLRVEQKVGSYQVYYRSNRNFMGGSPMTIFLDEIPVNPDMLLSITPSEIALVKVFSHFIGGPGNSPNGVLAIYTKKGDDLFKNNDEQPNNRFLYHGYSIIKQFYSPDYTVNTSDIKSFDHRITLLWIPDIFISAINPKIPIVFFNNERTRRFRIQVEGITKNGKIVCIEKIVGAEALNKPF